jgi:pimeloyl-ACP methyl ester carboxylesterase
MLDSLTQLIDTIPTHWRLKKTLHGPAAKSRADIRFVDLGNTLIRLRQTGTRGPSIVFATDPPIPLELYDDLIAELANRYRVTAFEMPGFGCSLPRIHYRFSMTMAIASVTKLLDQLPHGPHALALPCMTGFIAINIARARPDLVSKLVLLQTPNWQGAQQWLQGRDPKGLLQRPVLGQLALAAVKRKRIRQWYTAALGDKSQIENFAQATLTNFDQGGCFCLASGFQDFMHGHANHIQPAAQDTLIIWGKSDPSHRNTDISATQELAPNNRSLILEDVGHFPELEATPRFANELDTFLL